MPKNVYWPKMCLLNKNVTIDRKCAYWPKNVSSKRCLLKWHNPSYQIYQKFLLTENVPIDQKDVCWMNKCLLIKNEPISRKCVYWMKKKCLPKHVYWNVITLHIRYTKKFILTKKVSIGRKCAYWMKRYLLTKKCVY